MRVLKRDQHWHHYQFVELRIGATDESGSGWVQFMNNALGGTYGAEAAEVEVIYILAPTLAGRFLTLQTVANAMLSVDEIYVYQSP